MRKAITLWVISLMWAVQCHAAGFQSVELPNEAGTAIKLAIWYPSAAPTAVRDMGVFTQEVATNGEIRGKKLPLVIISHGTGGNAFSHYDTALELANAGFVVAALTHPGDNSQDQSRATDILERPKHVVAVINYMLGDWEKHAALAPDRIGMFGFSSGGFTAVVNVGGKPDLTLVFEYCKTHAADFVCGLVSSHKEQPRPIAKVVPKQLYDARIKAAVIAAPALGFTFDAASLRDVRLPIQLWRAEDDVLLPHPWYAEAVRKSLPMEPEYHVVPGAGHFDFLAPCSEKLARIVPPICASQDGFDRASFHRRFNAEVVAFFEKVLAEK
ncbi:alpha/beta hydrolase family protein [Massilia horti]|uniref:Dienelactone hydrolase n=1 Tax=Massilia horti TaxID=2562153 RepID=A0A4Y9SWB9_9BURK|nr:dienelactone hydrolase [Massilia horti]TFW30895.1 dienelactone hydrolase [Massilia horti]